MFCLNHISFKREFSANYLTVISIVILCLQWFTQLLLLPVLSIIHLTAVFAPVRFRRITSAHIAILMIIIIAVDIFLTGMNDLGLIPLSDL